MSENTKKFWTMGYGVTTKVAFLDRLRGISNFLDLPLSLVDIRVYASKSRNGQWCWQGGIQTHVGLYKTIAESKLPVEYYRLPSLANEYPGTKAGLEKYREDLQYCFSEYQMGFPVTVVTEDFMQLKERIRLAYKAIILLCTERKPFKESGIPNCHRVILAEELLRILGDGWEVEHLQ